MRITSQLLQKAKVPSSKWLVLTELTMRDNNRQPDKYTELLESTELPASYRAVILEALSDAYQQLDRIPEALSTCQ